MFSTLLFLFSLTYFHVTVVSETKRIKRDTPPAHYILKIKSFTQLLEIVTKTGDNKYESDEFEAAGYKWKLVVYPNGNKRNGEGHISMYIASTDKKAISRGCHVNALISLFVYDHVRDKYLTVQDGKIKRYHVLKTEHGFDDLISLEKFNDATNGYLVEDCCSFGAEVHVVKNTVKVNEFSVIKDPPNATFTWKIENFSTLQEEYYLSDTFDVGGYKWNLEHYPKGESEAKDTCMCMFLNLCIDGVTNGKGVYAECKMVIKDQLKGEHLEHLLDKVWFNSSDSWGYDVMLSDLHDATKGFLVNDTLIVEARITLV